MKIRPVGDNGHDEGNSRFLQFCERAAPIIQF